MPETAGGVFVQGGTIGNLSALVTARNTFREKRKDVSRWVIAASADAHSSIKSAADVMDVEILLIKPNQDGSLQQDAAEAAIDKYHSENPSHQVFALVATAGTTNLGIIDDLEGLARCAKSRDIWFHVDGAYGLAALCAPSVRPLFNGIELADSLIVDPHKWLFAPFDACALIYRNPELAKAAHLQKAAYLETLDEEDEWNPSDYAIHLTRRARGLPFWFSLAAHGTDEYAKAMERTMEVARDAANQVRNHKNLKLVIEPSLSIVAFERVGWGRADYEKWSDQLLADQIGFVTPSAHKGKPILRFAIVNPWTKESDISAILATL
jgi:glutamate/tyrosine decarboxylase-like PLP-dependent enzyme